jgi:hypothetical protein
MHSGTFASLIKPRRVQHVAATVYLLEFRISGDILKKYRSHERYYVFGIFNGRRRVVVEVNGEELAPILPMESYE